MMARAGYVLRTPTRTGKRPRRHPYDATIDGAVIMGMHFATSEEAVAYAEQILALERGNRLGRMQRRPERRGL